MTPRRVALVTLGCARNEVDSEEMAGRLALGGFELVDDVADADAVVVNTCGFVEAAKKDSIDTLLGAVALNADGRARTVVAVGCLAERYGEELAAALPEADAVLGFDHYPDLAARLDDLMHGRAVPSHTPRDRRLLPIVERSTAAAVDAPAGLAIPDLVVDEPDTPAAAPASGPQPVRRRLGTGPVAALKLASGCDRRCTFCAIPSFRGSFVSRRPHELLAEARWLAEQGVRELHLVSENSTSYGKDLGDIRLLESLLPELANIEGVVRVRLAYLQPAEMRPSLVEAIATTPGVAAYYDLSFQHASGTVLKAMRRFGDTERFLDLIAAIRAVAPEAGIRSNVIVGFPGETAGDYRELERFLIAARLDAVGVFGYSDEDGTEAAAIVPKVRPRVIAERLGRLSTLVETLTAERAEDRVGTDIDVLVETIEGDRAEGRAAHQAPEVDGSVTLDSAGLSVGDLVRCRVVGTSGVDLLAEPAHVGATPALVAVAR
ncbi:MAG TPA: 30S ribosomal protein S12 methylthiotransferase RimO [Mycobacteriales bacterium]|nr:30S ribosomal protein S12 methylthiotransferase RimO [Mycobacteriales bacterium]